MRRTNRFGGGDVVSGVLGADSRRVAAVDIGTITARLLVADVSAGKITEVERSTDVTHLGEGLVESGVLSAEAMERVEEVIARYAATMIRLGVEEYRCVATSASRDAANGFEFAERLSALGVAPEIVSGDEEARLAFSGALWGIEGDGVLVNDVGGGSTELVWGDSGAMGVAIRHAASIDVGARRVTEAYLHSDPPDALELKRARRWVREQLAPFFSAMPGPPSVTISLAGTATTLAAIDQRLEVYDAERVHGVVLARERLEAITASLASMTLAERRMLPGVHPQRAGVIVGGGLVLGAVLEGAGLDSTIVSEHDILYGIVLDVGARLARAGDGESG